MASNHGQLNRDLIGGSLTIKGKVIIDTDGILTVTAGSIKTLVVSDDLIAGNLFIDTINPLDGENTITMTGNVSIENDLTVCGNLRTNVLTNKDGTELLIDAPSITMDNDLCVLGGLKGHGSALTFTSDCFALWGNTVPQTLEEAINRIAHALAIDAGVGPISDTYGDLTTETKVIASDGVMGDRFGVSVSIDGDTAVVGAYLDDASRGSAYVFFRNNNVWTQQAKLVAGDGVAGDQFGFSTAIEGDTALIGAFGDDIARGSVYVFVRSGVSWSQQAKLVASDGAATDQFGHSVALDGDTAVMGARQDDTNTGSAYIFIRSGVSWSQQAKLVAGDGVVGDLFGYSVAVDVDTAVIGALGDDSATGSAYVFVRSGVSWSQQAKLMASDGVINDSFGGSVSVDGDNAVIGAVGDDTLTGSAYVFVRVGLIWVEGDKLIAGDAVTGARFGASVKVDGDSIVVGASTMDSGRGAAYIYTANSTVWTERAKLLATDGAASHTFGGSVGIGGGDIIIGANGNEAAYIYENCMGFL